MVVALVAVVASSSLASSYQEVVASCLVAAWAFQEGREEVAGVLDEEA